MLNDPIPQPGFCNYRGYCVLVEYKLICYCDLGYIGSNCQIDKTGYTNLSIAYRKLILS